MSWREPHDFETALLDQVRARWPEPKHALLPLARILCLAPRIEPLLLRNARRALVPGAGAEVETLFWFSPLVATRGQRDAVLHLGIARLLAEELAAEGPERMQRVWQLTCRHTRHWSFEDRLERDLRYHALGDDASSREQGRAKIQAILSRIQQETDEHGQLALARLAKRTLPVINPALGQLDETQLLAQYAALALGDAGRWVTPTPGEPRALPASLAKRLPPPFETDDEELQLGCELRWDPTNGLVLHFVEPDQSPHHLQLRDPPPAQLHLLPDGHSRGDWHSVSFGTRIPIQPATPGLRLTALDGRQWDLRSEQQPWLDASAQASGTDEPEQPPPLRLHHVPADAEQAEAIAAWLREQGIRVDLTAEIDHPGPAASDTEPPRAVRLWSKAARAHWESRKQDPTGTPADGLLLRIDDSPPPGRGPLAGHLLDWDWQPSARQAEQFARLLRRWWREGDWAETDGTQAPWPEPADAPEQQAQESDGALEQDPATEPSQPADPQPSGHDQEIQSLLAEIADPASEPLRRLAIGDRLAELGDPRAGVGTVEIEVDDEADLQPQAVAEPAIQTIRPEPSYPPEVQALLDELDDPATEPPRRLTIGDELETLGDPRPGVGVDSEGKPDIAWLHIPAGEFTYQKGRTGKQRIELPEFRISRYPITNRQYQAFIDDGGYEDERWWSDLEKPKPAQSSWPQSNRPRTNVSWYEAVAYCRWLSDRLKRDVQLPTEQQWERTAAGPNALTYPWGDDFRSGHANIDETWGKGGTWDLRQTTAVGLYPHGRSAEGADDLAGNVWEWCLNQYEKPQVVKADTSGASRVLRGGAWLGFPDYARTGLRFRDRPGYRDDGWGFRVCVASPIS